MTDPSEKIPDTHPDPLADIPTRPNGWPIMSAPPNPFSLERRLALVEFRLDQLERTTGGPALDRARFLVAALLDQYRTEDELRRNVVPVHRHDLTRLAALLDTLAG